ncbi:MAG: PH domain-containing protein [Mycoplasmataceae bacterium]|nr:PH domain-containing protein [Mycoplasmataceae bacterium]
MNLFQKITGRAEVSDFTERLLPYLSKNEKIVKVFKFWTDEVVLTDKGIYHWNQKFIYGKKRNFIFIKKEILIGNSIEEAGIFNLSNNIIILTRNPNLDIKIKLRKIDKEIAIKLANLIKEKIL